jgi:hypothetical protein
MRFYLAVLALPCFLNGFAQAEVLRFDSAVEWQTWSMPPDLVQVDAQGALRLTKYRKEIDAVRDAHLFTHPTQERGEAVAGGIWAAGSGRATAQDAIDGDPATFWQPDPTDELRNWFLDIDLGRAVLARHIRLTFPDRAGAQPLRQFTVYVTTGARIQATADVFKFEPVYRTNLPNYSTSLTIPLEYTAADSVLSMDSDLGLERAYENRYQAIQYISIVVEEQSPDAALAEVEVLSVGDNISIGTAARGTFLNGTVAVAPENLFDADLNTTNLITSGRGDQGWEAAGTWFYVDLGAVFFVDELFLYVLRRFEGTSGAHRGSAGSGHRILYSDGARSVGTSLPVPTSLDYSELFTHVNPKAEGLYRLRYKFRPRKMRYLFWHGLTDRGWLESKWAEFMLFSPGYPARVSLLSGFIDLGQIAGDARPKVIDNLSWDVDLPPSTQLQLRSRSGNVLSEQFTFFDRKGDVVTEEKWNSSPKVLRGKIDTALVVGGDWGAWSNVYQFPGEAFKSESPRRFVQLELILSSEDPQLAPVLNSLSVEFTEALVRQARGRIEPRSAQPNKETRFTYTLLPSAAADDAGFDLMRFGLPERIDLQSVSVQTAAGVDIPAEVSARGDSLLIVLPEPVRDEPLSVGFTARIVRNATVFGLDLGSSAHPDLWQSVEPAERRANIVMLPALTGSRQLINALELSSQVLTPNGDGVNDRVEIRFVAFKVEGRMPQGRIFDLAGRLIAELPAPAISGRAHTFTWSGLGRDGALVRPGVYLCRIELGADAGEDTVLRTIAVTY